MCALLDQRRVVGGERKWSLAAAMGRVSNLKSQVSNLQCRPIWNHTIEHLGKRLDVDLEIREILRRLDEAASPRIGGAVWVECTDWEVDHRKTVV